MQLVDEQSQLDDVAQPTDGTTRSSSSSNTSSSERFSVSCFSSMRIAPFCRIDEHCGSDTVKRRYRENVTDAGRRLSMRIRACILRVGARLNRNRNTVL